MILYIRDMLYFASSILLLKNCPKFRALVISPFSGRSHKQPFNQFATYKLLSLGTDEWRFCDHRCIFLGGGRFGFMIHESLIYRFNSFKLLALHTSTIGRLTWLSACARASVLVTCISHIIFSYWTSCVGHLWQVAFVACEWWGFVKEWQANERGWERDAHTMRLAEDMDYALVEWSKTTNQHYSFTQCSNEGQVSLFKKSTLWPKPNFQSKIKL